MKGKSVFIVSILVILVVITTIYITGKAYERTVVVNSYISLSVIGFMLMLFITYGLYKGFKLIDDFPKIKDISIKSLTNDTASNISNSSNIDLGEGITGLIYSILIWVVVTIVFTVLSRESAADAAAPFWFVTLLYWVFFRALKMVFSKQYKTKGRFILSIGYASAYTLLYLGWIYGIIYCAQIIKGN